MKPKLKPDLDLESIQEIFVRSICDDYTAGVSVRALAKKQGLSPMKVRKILITGGAYSTDLSEQILEMFRKGRSIGEISDSLGMTPSNVNSYLPYERVVYNMEQKSVEADRQQRYRDRKKNAALVSDLPADDTDRAAMITDIPVAIDNSAMQSEAKVRRFIKPNFSMIFVVGPKLRKLLPQKIYLYANDPLGRDVYSYDPFDPPDPEANIWCVELISRGRGKNKVHGLLLENAACGFICPAELPGEIPSMPKEADLKEMNFSSRYEVMAEAEAAMMRCRKEMELILMKAIREGLLSFYIPEEYVAAYTDSVRRIELAKGKASVPMMRIGEFIDAYEWEEGTITERFKIRHNHDSRKFGNSPLYREVTTATFKMLGMGKGEIDQWYKDYFGVYSNQKKE